MTATLPSLIFADDSNVTATPVLLVDEDGNYVAAGGGGGGGDASAANQLVQITAADLTNTNLGGVTEAAPATDTASSGLNGRLQRIAQRISSLIALLPAALGAGGGLKIDGSGTALPISAAALPLPTGAATEVTLLAQSAKLPASLGIKTAVGSLSIAPASDASFVVTAAALPLPAGAATAAGLTTINTTLGTPFQAAGALGASAAIIGTVRIDQTTPGTTNAVVATGSEASGVAVTSKPIGMGGKASSTLPTPVAANQRIDTWHGLGGSIVVCAAARTALTDAFNNSTIGTWAMPDGINTGPMANANTYFNNTSWDKMRGDVNGAVNQPFAMASSRWVYATPTGGIVNTTTPVTIISAAGVGVRNYLTALQIDFDALVTATEFVVQDDTAGAILFRAKLPSGAAGSRTYSFPVPLKGTANKIMQVVTLTATGAVVGVFPNAQGFQGV
jgi:hypothetical protein